LLLHATVSASSLFAVLAIVGALYSGGYIVVVEQAPARRGDTIANASRLMANSHGIHDSAGEMMRTAVRRTQEYLTEIK
jgi:hypothetical protein